jgi:site-specific recombinase XerD
LRPRIEAQSRRRVAAPPESRVVPVDGPAVSEAPETTSAPLSELARAANEYILDERARHGEHSHSLRARASDMRILVHWAETRGIVEARQLTRTELRAWIAGLHADGYARSSMARLLSTARSFILFRELRGDTIDRAALSLSAGRQPKSLPEVLTEPQAARLLESHTSELKGRVDPLALRDQVALELLYGTGMRAAELCSVRVESVAIESREIIVMGKGSKERRVLFGEPAAAAIREYLNASRPMLVARAPDHDVLLVNWRGGPLTVRGLALLVEKRAKEAGLTGGLHPFVCHTFAEWWC